MGRLLHRFPQEWRNASGTFLKHIMERLFCISVLHFGEVFGMNEFLIDGSRLCVYTLHLFAIKEVASQKNGHSLSHTWHMGISPNCRFLKQLALTSQVDGKLVLNASAFKRAFPNNLIGESISIN